MIKFLYIKKQKKSILLYNKQQRGFSLIELMVVLVILGIIILGLVTFFMGGTKSWVAGQSQLEAQRNARQAMDRMVREIRHGELVTDGSTNNIAVDIPALGATGSEYNVTYSWGGASGDPIYRNTNPLINNVNILDFSYYDYSGSQVYPPDNTVSKVHINLEVDVDGDGNPDITLNTDVNLRNYGLQ